MSNTKLNFQIWPEDKIRIHNLKESISISIGGTEWIDESIAIFLELDVAERIGKELIRAVMEIKKSKEVKVSDEELNNAISS